MQTIPKPGSRVTAAIPVEADKNSFVPGTETDNEQDADELVHEQPDEYPTDSVEQDLDEIVHEQGSITTAKETEDDLTEEEDMDDLVHRQATDLDANDR